ncbi:hypothetical protein PG911_11295 [Tenacibaculum ovolyticum]|uniref:hypothetical protein n=1 Tax=Tenacibaculum ovolyticum TaxID=104270 RepID=UPI001F3BCB50|nr:hypothetical protein [Tenacibaculum ovolyticum]WBX75243.1 hypothetical protein PG911_11295 [Tenacibaculum ovolyticum]
MNTIKKTVTILILLIATTVLKAQTNDVLTGKWETTYKDNNENVYITYQFKYVKEKLKCYSVFIKDDSGKKGKYESLVMKNITLNNGNGKAIYIYNDNGVDYEFKANLLLKNENTLNVSYSVLGYSDTETWKRLK